ncbi:MAG: hypothetical protein IPQ07_44695 [Myxococcales bacterium]|nr:hypothetical protein [Myxococcales bacterium]
MIPSSGAIDQSTAAQLVNKLDSAAGLCARVHPGDLRSRSRTRRASCSMTWSMHSRLDPDKADELIVTVPRSSRRPEVISAAASGRGLPGACCAGTRVPRIGS